MSLDTDTGRLTIGSVWNALEQFYGADRLNLILLAPLWQDVTDPFAVLLAGCAEHLETGRDVDETTEVSPDEALGIIHAVEWAMEMQLKTIAERQ